MKLPAKIVAWVLPWFLTGCWFQRHQKTPAPAIAPVIQTTANAAPPAVEPPPEITIPTQPQVTETKLPYEPPKPPPRRRKQSVPPVPETQQVAGDQPAVNAIGQLSTGDPTGARYQTENSINEIERVLNNLNRQLGDQEQATAAHIREFIKQAREALKSGDVDGASTLTAKAKVLLQELTR
jgi:hypothetical protein